MGKGAPCVRPRVLSYMLRYMLPCVFDMCVDMCVGMPGDAFIPAFVLAHARWHRVIVAPSSVGTKEKSSHQVVLAHLCRHTSGLDHEFVCVFALVFRGALTFRCPSRVCSRVHWQHYASDFALPYSFGLYVWPI